jgi:hypothetical protein
MLKVWRVLGAGVSNSALDQAYMACLGMTHGTMYSQ